MTDDIAEYGLADADSLGRAHAEPVILPPFEFDRRRVQSSAAFRRLQYKTQVFISPRDDHYRTRLTHTLEVAGVARIMARALRVNVGLAEAIALAHDLGHPPFGHAGEAALHRLMKDHGGFEHNAQSLRVVDYLEHPFPPFRGLNLTYEVRSCLARHRTIYDDPAPVKTADARLQALLQRGSGSLVEGQVAAMADRLAYDLHDLEDALSAEILEREDLAPITLWQTAAEPASARFAGCSLFALSRTVIETLQERLVGEVVTATTRKIRERNIDSPDAARRYGGWLVILPPEVEHRLRELEDLLRARVYGNAEIRARDREAGEVVAGLFEAYVARPEELPPRFRERVGEQGPHRVICDYIAGMTDRFCRNEWLRLVEKPRSDAAPPG